jgi:hypothetical protein
LARTLISFLIGIPSLLFAIYVFGWIVSGDANLLVAKVNREKQPVLFWTSIIVLCIVSLALLAFAFLYSTGPVKIF